MTEKELKKLGFKPIKAGKNYYIFVVCSTLVTRKKKLCYGVYPIDVKTGKTLNVVEYISITDIFKNKTINKAKRNLIKKLKKTK